MEPIPDPNADYGLCCGVLSPMENAGATVHPASAVLLALVVTAVSMLSLAF